MATRPSTLFSATQRVLDDENLLTEILIWLHTKLLIKLKSVCKQWRSIISSDMFAQIHTNTHSVNSDPNTIIVLQRPRFKNSITIKYRHQWLSFPAGNVSSNQFRFEIPFASPELIKSYNGLLLILLKKKPHSYCVYNPATLQYKTLPELSFSPCVSGVYLAFDPSRFKGFRVVCLTGYVKLIYSYNSTDDTASWKEWPPSAPFEHFDLASRCDGEYYKGAIYLATLNESWITIDVENEKLGTFPSPRISPPWNGSGRLVKLNDNLHFLAFWVCFEVFALAGYEEGWFLKYRVFVPDLDWGMDRFPRPWAVLFEVGEERRLQMVLNINTKVIRLYDFQTKIWKTVSSNTDAWSYACPFTPTLALF